MARGSHEIQTRGASVELLEQGHGAWAIAAAQAVEETLEEEGAATGDGERCALLLPRLAGCGQDLVGVAVQQPGGPEFIEKRLGLIK